LPQGWEALISECNFPLACHNLADFLEQGKREAAKKGGVYAYKDEFVNGWEHFAADPCQETAVQFLRGAPDYLELVLEHVFLPSCPGGTSYVLNELQKRVAGFPPSVYPFDSDIGGIQGLTELSETEYLAFPRSFRGEVIYNASALHFLNRDWSVMIGAVDNRVYNIAASHEEGGTKEIATTFLNEVLAYCSRELGKHTERQEEIIAWDLHDGSIMVQFAPILDSLTINLFSTSKVMRGFKRL
jgi:hypothetical protein